MQLPGRTIGLKAGVWFALLCIGMFNAPAALGECSQHVVSGKARPGLSSFIANLDEFAATMGEGGASWPPSQERSPCSGPSCSRGSRGESVPASQVDVRSEPWCSTSWLSSLTDPGRAYRPEASIPLRVRIVAAPIDHPPRPHF
jgi:hypothetical protein